jgi:hypothetical protein
MDGYNDIVLNVNKGVHSYRIKTFVIDQSHHSLVVSLLLASLDQLTRRQSITLSSYHHNAIPKFFPQNNKGDALIKCLWSAVKLLMVYIVVVGYQSHVV